MTFLLLAVIYIAFIGLGIPDSLFGTAWPAIYAEFGLPVDYASFVTLIISLGTVTSSLVGTRIINKIGTGAVTAICTTMTALALLAFSLSGSFIWLCVFALPLGLGAGSIDSALNNYVALHYKATHMNFLHCFYGIGVTVSPYLMSIALGKTTWRGGYRIIFFVQLSIALLTIIALPLWKRVGHDNSSEAQEEPRTLSIPTMLGMKRVRLTLLVFLGTCAVEFIAGTWASTYLVNVKNLPVESAARYVTLYYAGMALGRFSAGLLAKRLSSWQLIRYGQTISLAALVLLALPLPTAFSGAALFLLAYGNGPVFPNMTQLAPTNFGKDVSQSIISLQMAASYVAMMLLSPLFGFLAEKVSVTTYPWFLLVMYFVMLAATLGLMKDVGSSVFRRKNNGNN